MQTQSSEHKPSRQSVLRACITLSFLVYLAFGASIMLCTWTIATGDGDAGAVFGAMLFFYIPSILAPYFFGVTIDNNARGRWLSGAGLVLLVTAWVVLVTYGAMHAFICLVLISTSFFRELSNILVRKRLATWAGDACLVQLNSWETTARRIGYLLGSLVGGGLLAILSLEVAFAVLLGLLTVVVVLCSYVERCHDAAPRRGRLRTAFGRMRGNLSGTRVPIWVGIFVAHTVVSEVLNAALAVFVVVAISDNPLDMSYISNAFVGGAIIGGMVLSRVVAPRNPIVVLASYICCLAAAVYLFSLATGVLAAVIGYFCVGLFFQGRILCQALIQSEYGAEHQAKLQSFISVISGAVTMLCLAVLSLLPASIEAHHYYTAIVVVLAIAFAVCSVVAMGFRQVKPQLHGIG